MAKRDAESLTLKAKCVVCKHKWDMNEQHIKEARGCGCAMCPKCWSPATVEKAEATGPRRVRGKKGGK